MIETVQEKQIVGLEEILLFSKKEFEGFVNSRLGKEKFQFKLVEHKINWLARYWPSFTGVFNFDYGLCALANTKVFFDRKEFEIMAYNHNINNIPPIICITYQGCIEKTDGGLYLFKGTWKDLHAENIKGTFEMTEQRK